MGDTVTAHLMRAESLAPIAMSRMLFVILTLSAAQRLADPDVRPSDHAGHRVGTVALVAASPGTHRWRCRRFSAFEQCAHHGRSFHQWQLPRDRRIVRWI